MKNLDSKTGEELKRTKINNEPNVAIAEAKTAIISSSISITSIIRKI